MTSNVNRRVGITFWISLRHQIPPSFPVRVIRSTTMESPITNSSPHRSTFPCRNPLSSNVLNVIWKNWTFQNSSLRSASLLFIPNPPRLGSQKEHAMAVRTSKRSETSKASTGKEVEKNEAGDWSYRTACREAGTLINESRKKFISDEINNCSNSKQRWSKINNILHPKNKTKLQCDINSTTFIQFFHNKIVQLGLSIKSKIFSSNITVPPPDPIHTGQEFSTLPTVTPSEISKLRASIPSKSSNLDYIPTSILKTFHPSSPDLQTCLSIKVNFLLISKSLKSLHCWKNPTSTVQFQISVISPKSSNASSCFVSGHSSHLRLCSIPTSRHMYRQGYSTETALLFTLNNIKQSADHDKSTILVSLNLSSAFDTIDHHLLLERLRTMFGVTGPALNWAFHFQTPKSPECLGPCRTAEKLCYLCWFAPPLLNSLHWLPVHSRINFKIATITYK